MPVALVGPIDLEIRHEEEDDGGRLEAEGFAVLARQQEHPVEQLVKPIERDWDRFHSLLVVAVFDLPFALVGVEVGLVVPCGELVSNRWLLWVQAYLPRLH